MYRLGGLLTALLLGLCSCVSAPVPPIPAPPNADNLLLLTIDTLRSDYVGAYGATTVQSPNMDALAASGLLFERAYTTAPVTAPAHASILTGRYPSEHGVLYNSMLLKVPMTYNEQSTVLSSHLALQGFRTGAIVTAMPLTRRYGFAKGFDFHRLVPPRSLDTTAELGGSSEDALAAARDWLETRGSGRFFLWVHLYESHVPFVSPPEIHARLGSEPGRVGMEDVGSRPAEAFRAAYTAEVLQVDDAVGAFVDLLDELDLRDNTLVSLVADHGEYLGEDGLHGHHLAREEVMRIPMMIHGPGVEPSVHTGAVSAVDLAPTLLDLMDLPTLPGASGRSLAGLDRASSRPIYGEWRNMRLHDVGTQPESRDWLVAVWDDQKKLVHSMLSAEDRVFDLSVGEQHEPLDPAAKAAWLGPLERERLRYPMLKTPESDEPLGRPSSGVELLKALGYVE